MINTVSRLIYTCNFIRFVRLGQSYHKATEQHRGEVHPNPAERRLLWRESVTRVCVHDVCYNWCFFSLGCCFSVRRFQRKLKQPENGELFILCVLNFHSDDLRTANIIACDPDGVSCLVIDRETFNQLISGLDEIRTRYKDDIVERMRYAWCIVNYYTLYIAKHNI